MRFRVLSTVMPLALLPLVLSPLVLVTLRLVVCWAVRSRR